MNRDLDGIWKRCPCPKKRWSDCPHPWYMSFKRGKNNGHRFNINKRAGKPRGYVMAKSEAEGLRDLYRSQIRARAFESERTPDTRLSIRDVAKDYAERYVNMPSRRPGPRRTMTWYLDGMLAVEIPARGGKTVAFGDKIISEVTCHRTFKCGH